MRPKQPAAEPREDLFRTRLENLVDRRHALVRLAGLIDWGRFEAASGREHAPSCSRSVMGRKDATEPYRPNPCTNVARCAASGSHEAWPVSIRRRAVFYRPPSRIRKPRTWVEGILGRLGINSRPWRMISILASG